MPAFLELSPGLVIWTIVNFSVFAFIIAKYGWKPMMDGLAARENAINESIQNAADANTEAKRVLDEAKARIANAQQEMMGIVREGKQQAEAMVQKAGDDAEVVKQQKIVESEREITRQKEEAIAELRGEVATLVVQATEMMLGRSMKDDDHKKIVESYVNEISKN